MITAVLVGVLAAAALAAAAVGVFLTYVVVRYSPHIVRVFEEKPLFLPVRVPPADWGEDVRFPTADGLSLAGTYFRARTARRTGVIVFCHEYLSDRWSVLHYAGHLLDLGFDLFSFDFRNHGQSDALKSYHPLQWMTRNELVDLRAALGYLRTRPDADPAGFGLLGVSRGGNAALCVAAEDSNIWGVATDGAFSTRGTMLAYILRWAEIYVGSKQFYRGMPTWMFAFVGWAARQRSQWRLGCTFPDVEPAVGRLSPRPWLMIHGERDVYIGPEIARRLFERGGEPKELWIVPGAKHNRCREVAPEAYASRLVAFFRAAAPRRVLEPSAPAAEPVVEVAPADLATIPADLLQPIPR